MEGYLIDSQYFAYIVVFTVLQRYDFETKSQPFAYIITAIFLFIDYEKDQRHHHPLHRDYAPKFCPSFDVHKNL